MMDYQLYNLSSTQFEDLVCDVCHEILGTATISFAEGPDGGRDARFIGKSNSFPSESLQWQGKFIIQAKRKASAIASCSDSDFKKDIEKEIEKIKILRVNKEVDNYLIFTTRSYPAISGEKLINQIRTSIPIDNAEILGKETITRYLNKHEDIAKKHGLSKFKDPLRFNSEQVKLVVEAFHSSKGNLTEADFSQKFITKEEKNRINNLSKDYFEELIKDSLPYFKSIDGFLENPRNKKFRDYYLEVVNELKFKIIVKRDEFDKFDEIFSYLYDAILKDNPDLVKNNMGRLVHTMLHYMYWHCDIGKDA